MNWIIGVTQRITAQLWLVTAITVILASEAVSADYDLVIRNGRVLDGAGNPWIRADIAIHDGKLAKVGRVLASGHREIDATGKYVSPGWIDMMDQSGEALREVGLATNKINMGVTTLIAGESGTPVPAANIPEYFAELEKNGISVNFGTYYSAIQARIAVLGESDADPSPEQLNTMKSLISTAMEAGAMGITTALIYPPSSYEKTENLIELARVTAQYGGLYASHIRDESSMLLEAITEAIEIGEESGAGVEIFHLKAAYHPNWGKDMKLVLAMIQAARDRGVDVAADVYPYLAGGTGLGITAPNWVFSKGWEQAIEWLNDPNMRTRMKKDLAAGATPEWTNLVYASGGWENVMLANSYLEEYEKFHGKRFAEIGRALNRDPADIAWDMILAAQPNMPQGFFFAMGEADLRLALQSPFVSIGSDAASALGEGSVDALGLAHPRSYGTFPRIIAEYVRDEGVLSLPEAIRKMTSWPASRMGLSDRGVLREGLAADLVIFDFDRIEDTASWSNPTSKPEGIEFVIVNGEVVLDSGRHTGARPGKVLRGPGYLAD